MQQTIEIIHRIWKAYNTMMKSDRGLKKKYSRCGIFTFLLNV